MRQPAQASRHEATKASTSNLAELLTTHAASAVKTVHFYIPCAIAMCNYDTDSGTKKKFFLFKRVFAETCAFIGRASPIAKCTAGSISLAIFVFGGVFL